MEQAVRDGLTDRNPARITGWQREYRRAEDELDDPRSLALPDWATLTRLADALVARSHGEFQGWGRVILFAACAAARIGEVSGCRVGDVNTDTWTWTVRRQTTTRQCRPGQRTGAAVHRTSWRTHLDRSPARLTWMADAGVPVHHLQKIAGHGQLTTTQRYLHPNRDAVTDAGELCPTTCARTRRVARP
jgi:integrase